MRKFRISMDPGQAKWYVEVSGWTAWLGFLTPIYKTFDSFYAAQEWAHQQGLHEAYTYAPLNKTRTDASVLDEVLKEKGTYSWTSSIKPPPSKTVSSKPPAGRSAMLQPSAS